MVLTPTSYQSAPILPESNPPSTELALAYQRIAELTQENQQLKQTLVNWQQTTKPNEPLFTLHLANHMPFVLYVYDIAGSRNIYLNQAIETVLGYSVTVAQQMSWPLTDQLLHPDDISQVLSQTEALHHSPDNQFFDTEYRLKHQAGHWQWMHVRVAVLTRTLTGEPKLIVGTMEDITERKKVKAALERRVVMEQLMAIISTDFINAPTHEIGEQLQQALLMIGHFFRVDRSYIFLLTINDLFTNYYEWYADGIEPGFNPAMRPALEETFPWFNEQSRAAETVVLSNMNELSVEAGMDRFTLNQRRVKSLITLPIMAGGHYIGLLGLESIRQTKAWPHEEIRLLQLIAQIFGSGLERLHTDLKLRRTNETLETLVAEQIRTLQQIVQQQQTELAKHKQIEQSIQAIGRQHRQQVERLRLLHQATLHLNVAASSTTLAQIICQHAQTLLITDSVGVYLYDETVHQLLMAAGVGLWAHQAIHTLNVDEGIVGEVYRQRTTQYLENVTNTHQPQLVCGIVTTIQALLVVPLLKDRQVLGVLMVARGVPNQHQSLACTFTADDIRIAEMLVAQAGLALHNTRLHTTSTKIS